MATIRLPPDFKEFLQLLSAHQVEYLLIGGYAVGYHGYPRATADMDIWGLKKNNFLQNGPESPQITVSCSFTSP